MTEKTDHDIPFACSLSTGEVAEREGAWRRFLGTSVLAHQRVPGGLRLVVSPGAGSDLSALIDLEQKCCPWIAFDVNGESVTMTAQGEGEEILVQMFSWKSPADAADPAALPR